MNNQFKETEIGPIPEEWDVVKLGDYFSVETGKHVSKADRLNSGTFEIMGANGVIGFTNNFLIKGKAILTGRVGTLGELRLVDKELWPSDNVLVIKPKNKEADLDFLYYYLKLFDFSSLNVGSTQPLITQKDTRSILLPAPELQEQTLIASVLSSLDDKVELNRKINKNLEEIASALFKRWFVDFEFPDANGKPYRSSGGKMVKSELGEVPEGWRVGVLSELLSNISERYTGNNQEDAFPYVPIDQIVSKSLSLHSVARSEDAKSSLIRFHVDDILFGAMRPYFHKVAISPFEGLTRTTCFVFRPKSSELYVYSALLLFQEETIDYASANSEGSTIPYAKWNGSMEKMPVLLPTKTLINNFNEITKPLLKRIRDSYFEQNSLQDMRDSLLPRLMSGKIRV